MPLLTGIRYFSRAGVGRTLSWLVLWALPLACAPRPGGRLPPLPPSPIESLRLTAAIDPKTLGAGPALRWVPADFKEVYLWMRIRPSVSERRVRILWYEPGGTLYLDSGPAALPAASGGEEEKSIVVFHKLAIQGHRTSQRIGHWRVAIRIDGLFADSLDFQILRRPANTTDFKPTHSRRRLPTPPASSPKIDQRSCRTGFLIPAGSSAPLPGAPPVWRRA